jgi:hypothetical protein
MECRTVPEPASSRSRLSTPVSLMGVLRFRVFDALLFFFMPVSFCTFRTTP